MNSNIASTQRFVNVLNMVTYIARCLLCEPLYQCLSGPLEIASCFNFSCNRYEIFHADANPLSNVGYIARNMYSLRGCFHRSALYQFYVITNNFRAVHFSKPPVISAQMSTVLPRISRAGGPKPFPHKFKI
jgi:hypothetical protein